MAKKSNVYKFDVIEKVIGDITFTTKEEVVKYAETMRDVALKNKKYSDEVKNAFVEACEEIKNELTLDNLKEIKKIINS